MPGALRRKLEWHKKPGKSPGKICSDPANAGNHLSRKLFQGRSPLKPEPPAVFHSFFLQAVGPQKLLTALLFETEAMTYHT